MADQRNIAQDDLIYYFQINYLHQMRRITKQQIYQPQISEIKISKSNSSHIPPSSLSSQNLSNTFAKNRNQKQEKNQLQFKPQSISTKQLNQIFINNRNIIRKHRISSIQHQTDQSLDTLITRKKSSNYTFTETSQKRIMGSQYLYGISINQDKDYVFKFRVYNLNFFLQFDESIYREKCDWLWKPIKINLDKSRIHKIRHDTIRGENFKNLNGWQIEYEQDCDF